MHRGFVVAPKREKSDIITPPPSLPLPYPPLSSNFQIYWALYQPFSDWEINEEYIIFCLESSEMHAHIFSTFR